MRLTQLLVTLTALVALALVTVVHAVYTCDIYVTSDVGFGYTVFDISGYPAIRFAINFPYNACVSAIIFGWTWNLSGTLFNVTPDQSLYFHNLTIDFAYFGDLGVWTAGANVSVYEFASDRIELVVWRDGFAISRVLATHELPDLWTKILSRGIAYVALWLPNATWNNIHVYVNGSLWDGYMTDCVSVLQLADTPAVCFDRDYHIVVLRLPMHSRYIVVIEQAVAGVAPPTKLVEVTSVTLTFAKTEVEVNEPVSYTVHVTVNDTSWSGTLDYTLVCTGPTTVKDTGTISVSAGSGSASGTVTFPEARTYTCSAIVNGKESNIVYVKVVERKIGWTPIIIVVILVVLIALVVVYELERRKGTTGERGVVVRIRL